jgi:uncharacterized protein YecE (DUF72 family)
MEAGTTLFRVGMGGWEHDVFDQCFYPRAGMSSAEKLAYYARFFQTVEVRATFWDDQITARDAREWLEAVREHPGFEFNVKLHSSFTHGKSFRPEASRTMRSLLQELSRHNRLGSLLVQFPYSFTHTSSNRFHAVRLAEIFAGYPMHVEFRHESWHQNSLIPFLKENSLGAVSADIPRIRHYMPFITGVSGDSAYLRLHGRNEKGWLLNGYDARYDYLYNSRETHEIEKRLEALVPRCGKVTVIANNTTGGKSIPLALHLVSALRGGKAVPVPGASLKTFPHLRPISLLDTGEAPLLDIDFRRAI